MMATGSKRSIRMIKEKYNAIKDIQSGMSKEDVAEKYKIPQNTFSTWVVFARKDHLNLGSRIQNERIQSRLNMMILIKLCLYSWFISAGINSVPVSGIILKEKAIKFAPSLKIDNFTTSEGGSLETM